MKTEKFRNKLGRFVKGYKRSIESRINQGEVLKKKYEDGEMVAWHKGRKGVRVGVEKGHVSWNKNLTIEDDRVRMNIEGMVKTRKKNGYISDKLKKKIKEGTNTPEFKLLVSKRRSKQIFPFKDTILERSMKRIFKKVGIKFKKHVPFKVGKRYHQVDFLLKRNNIVIECDGEYWHRYPLGTKQDRKIDKALIKKRIDCVEVLGQ